MAAHRLRAPSADGTLLAEPALAGVARTLASNAERLSRWDHDFQGLRADRLRTLARGQVIERARALLSRYGCAMPGAAAGQPVEHLVVTGHQPELFHPGVWVKNFATAAIARQPGAVGLNLIVDNDILKTPGIRVPRRSGRSYRVERVEFDEWRGEIPYEALTVSDEATFATFAARVRQRLPETIADPLLDDFWPRALQAREVTDRLGYRFAMARHGVEASWGVCNLEVPVSAVCETEGFLWFVCHVIAHLPRFQSVHNEALRGYRTVYGIRSKHHPVPDLGRQDDWLEAPFWVWRDGQPRRRPLLARSLGQTIQLRIAGDDAPLMELPLSADRDACCAVEQLLSLPARGVRLRTRALTTTMFARLLLGDLFLHGIGGAKYDELGDDIVRGFFGFEPPTYMTMSMTLWLGLGDDPGAAGRLAAVDRSLRDLDWKPERWLDRSVEPEMRTCIERKRAAIAAQAVSHPQRLERFRTIRRCNEIMQTWVAKQRKSLLDERARVLEDARRDGVARSREFAMVLHSQARLREVLGRVIAGGTGPGPP
jgi:hypothetical protein